MHCPFAHSTSPGAHPSYGVHSRKLDVHVPSGHRSGDDVAHWLDGTTPLQSAAHEPSTHRRGANAGHAAQ